MSGLALFVAVFLACSVEAVEATTIVLAAGTARNWRSALLGASSALGALILIIGLFGPAISTFPIGDLRLLVGVLLLVFGLQWVRKAILRSSGYKAKHDEDAIFKEELDVARTGKAEHRFGVSDWYAFTLSFKGVLLEGLEVAFIVLTFGTIQHEVGLASVAALIAVALVAMAGFALRKPLARVPENSMKFIVGIMLTSFGIFWGAEGAGAKWPGSDASLLAIIAFMALISYLLVALLRRRHQHLSATLSKEILKDELDEDSEEVLESKTLLTGLKAFGNFWFDFLIGDDWRGTIGILAALTLTSLLQRSGSVSWWILPLSVSLLLPYNLMRVTRSR